MSGKLIDIAVTGEKKKKVWILVNFNVVSDIHIIYCNDSTFDAFDAFVIDK